MNLELKRTPLNADHKALKAKMIDFGGWEMPVQYTNLIDEHKTVRSAVGLFDVSHMGEIIVEGPQALDFLQKVTVNDVAKLEIGQAQYSAMLYHTGALVDDIIVYKRAENKYFLCVNAGNSDKDFIWLQHNCPVEGVILENHSENYGQIAVQGPKAVDLVTLLTDKPLDNIKYYSFIEANVCDVPCIVSRTGYTGERGFEIYVPSKHTSTIWNALLEKGKTFGVKPIGLGARDTLRLEVAYLLYGNDMDFTTTALEAGLSWIIKFDKGNFIGKQALINQKDKGSFSRLVGFEMVDNAIGRHGYRIFSDNTSIYPVGHVTSGTKGPSLGINFGMAYVPAELSKEGSAFFVEVRGERKQAKVVKKPFYTQGTANK